MVSLMGHTSRCSLSTEGLLLYTHAFRKNKNSRVKKINTAVSTREKLRINWMEFNMLIFPVESLNLVNLKCSETSVIIKVFMYKFTTKFIPDKI